MANFPAPISIILQVAIPVPIDRLFDYIAPESNLEIKPGCRVLIPFGQSKKIGFVVQILENSKIDPKRLKAVIEVLDTEPLIGKKDIQLLDWASRYYHHPLGEVYSAAFPVSLRKGHKAVLKQEKYYKLSAKGLCVRPEQLKRSPRQQQLLQLFQTDNTSLNSAQLAEKIPNWRPAVKALLVKELLCSQFKTVNSIPSVAETETALQANPQQAKAIDQLSSQIGRFSVTLLEGVTGSGKTEVYMQVIQKVLDLGLQVLVLLPEITLTPQLQTRFKQRFSIALSVSHSKLSDSQRLRAWLEMQQGQHAIMLGTRSALFTPLKRPGLIILDEEHDSSFKQQDGFRFSARDLAVVRGKFLNIPVILGTATPSLESLYNSHINRYQRLHLSERAGQAIKPRFLVFDMRNKILQDGLSEPLIAEINKTLAKNEQVLLFLNRRGYAPVQICHACAWVARCRHCDSSLVIHFDEKRLRCHHCGHQQHLLSNCPNCKTGELKALGLGTERVEKSLHELFPGKNIVRLDRDSTQRKGSLENHLDQINQGKVDIILGTQMLAKGHHFPNVTLVALLDVDSGLFSIDFHATEKLAQLVVQVAGRAGRAEKPGKVILQTHQPEHPVLTLLLKQGYQQFALTALVERKQAMLPPYSYQALLRVYAKYPDAPLLFLNNVCDLTQTMDNLQTLILGPVPAPMAKRAGNHHFQLLLQNNQRQKLQLFLDQLVPQLYTLKEAKKVRWSLDVDPVDLY